MIKEGMYVRCPIPEENSPTRTFYYGQVKEIDEINKKCKVKFHDLFHLKRVFNGLFEDYWYSIKEIDDARSTPLRKARAEYEGIDVEILGVSKKPCSDDPYFSYFVRYAMSRESCVFSVSEKDLSIHLTQANYNPVNQMIDFELHNPKWYLKRRQVSKSLHMIKNSPTGFEDLLSTRVQLYRHQVDTIVRGLSDDKCRLMLADEVGLGKTIEALTIVRGMQNKYHNFKTLIISPDSLIYQWQVELKFKYWCDNVPIWGTNNIEKKPIVLIPLSIFILNFMNIIEDNSWDMCVVDEAHKLLLDQDAYNAIEVLSNNIEHILLLSATPILNMGYEYQRLLSLLNPVRFSKMARTDFNALLSKQTYIRDIVSELSRDTSDYLEYNLSQEFSEKLLKLNELINDPKISMLINSISSETIYKGFENAKLALAYISEFYQIERGIIRHRRKEIEDADIKRSFIKVPYSMMNEEFNVYESETYNQLLSFLESIQAKSKSLFTIKRLIHAISSSPFALREVLENSGFSLKHPTIVRIVDFLNLWEKFSKNEIQSISKLDKIIIMTRFSALVKIIEDFDIAKSKKIIVFSGFTSTSKAIMELLSNVYGRDSCVLFTSDMDSLEMHLAATQFQDEGKCRFIICDESGGEGRNFQIADLIIHFDLPWSPALIEQRIGRLDRIGRDPKREVVSIVVYAEGTLDEDIFNIFESGLSVFSQSLCGMEISFEQIQSVIDDAIIQDLRYGLSHCLEEVKKFARRMFEEVEKERYFDLARQLDTDLRDRFEKSIAHFTKNDSEELMDTMMAWPEMVGFKYIDISDPYGDGSEVLKLNISSFREGSRYNALYVLPPITEELLKSKSRDSIYGTFSRTTAIQHENVAFFAPKNPIFESIASSAFESYKGRCCAFEYSRCGFDYSGFIFTWNISFNPFMILSKGYSMERINLVMRYLPIEQIINTFPMSEKYTHISNENIFDEIENQEDTDPIHWGKREDGKIKDFIKEFRKGWQNKVKDNYSLCRTNAINEFRVLIDIQKADEDLHNIVVVQKARRLFYQDVSLSNNLLDEEIIDALLFGLKHPLIELDSIAFVILSKGKISVRKDGRNGSN